MMYTPNSEGDMSCDCLVVSAGYCALAFIAYKIAVALYNVLWPYVIATPLDLHAVAGGKWAVITGATDGIGKAYAYEMARKGFNIFAVSRTQSKLDEIEKDIREKYSKVEVKTFAFNFCVGSVDAYAPLLDALNEVEVGVLVNNVGMSYEYPEVLHNVEGGLKRIGDITTINTLPNTILCSSLIKQMLPRKKGIIVNISSSAANNHMALWAVYSATKKYVTWLSKILRMEYSDSGLIIQTISPMMVATKMSKVRKTSFFTPNAEQFVASAARSIGLTDETTGFLSHQLQVGKLP
ncbi:oxidoreductase, short chain dehydrogenase/reductase family protein [Dictyocaulus viviparus]|uniref:Oxidoreductase, short chain dehydrogenase/reductase family protein n=1 Tax=Dictyocaulus viviparus TaxID=29172 RepID=A0A0D8XWL5_DICVI|nr:oxidoreductase, short chain dehydrogenase/reductase family protein [Dictyocaulus viviparus]